MDEDNGMSQSEERTLPYVKREKVNYADLA